jgi:asparagine synthase (glutamine-hydrolysing)
VCGVAGFYVPGRPAELSRVREMCRQITHRGPDDQGYYTGDGCALGMVRLSIIDLSTGHQPIANEDQTLWVVFNGEIYNYRELRADLAARGHRFATNSDTEVLLHLYEEYGTDGISRLRGMFAYAIWDSRRRKLLLVRDRFGKKPLYYAQIPEGLFFASELKCLREAGLQFDLDPEAIRQYFHFTYIPDPASPFKQVRKLPAGAWLEFSEDGSVRRGRYWEPPPPAESIPEDMDESAAAARLREVFDESVRIRMIADVPLGAFLSGGVDSSSVVASMALQSPEPVKTFSIGFEEQAYNELEYAACVAARYKTDHHTLIVRPDSVNLVEKLVRHFDEPFADSSAIPTFLVSGFAVQHVKVALTGDGGDELFAGYNSFFRVNRLRRWDWMPQALRRFVSFVSNVLPYSAYGKNYLHMISRPTPLERYFEVNYSPWQLSRSLLQPRWLMPLDEAYLRRAFAHCLLPDSADILSQALYFEATANLVGDMLVKVDRMSMAQSLEVRCPMLDHRLAELAARIPAAWKMRGQQGKYCFIQAMRDRLPEQVWNRPKRGFSVPVSQWFRGPLREMLWDHLTSSRFLDRGFVSPEFLRHILTEHDTGRRDNRTWLWGLLVLELWCRQWLDAGSSAPGGATA